MQFFKKRDAILYQSKLDKKKDIYLFAKDKNETGAKIFYINSLKNIYNLILKGKTNFYEFWTESQELKFSLDIDFENTEKNANKIVKNICKFVIKELKEFHPNYSFSDVIILKSLPTDIKQNSFHIIFDKVKFKNHKQCRGFFNYLKSKNEMPYCDSSIYNNTVLRCCYCEKKGKQNTLKPFKFKNVDSIYTRKSTFEFFSKTLITNVDSCKVLVTTKFETNVPENIVYASESNNDSSYEIFNERKLKQILNSLPEKYVDNYDLWIKIGMILHNINTNYFKLWDNWSKTNSKYAPNLCLQKWKTFQSYDDRKKLGLGTLIKYCQTEGLTDIIPKYDIKSIVESYDSLEITTGSYKKTVINQQYLTPELFKKHLGSKLLCVQSEKGTGKTHNLLKAIFPTDKYESILFLSSRRTFGIKLLSDLETYGFKLYSNIKSKHITEKRVICQIDSLERLESDKFDLIIIDECESLSRYITSQHFIKNRQSSMIVEHLDMYLREANNVFILDADLSERCMKFYTRCCKALNSYKLIVNTFKAYKNYKVKYTNYPSWVSTIMEDIEANKKLVIPMASNNKAKDLQCLIKNKFSNKKILLIHKESDDADKLEKLMKINETWIKYDVIIYTPSVCMGVSFDVPNYFNRIYAYGCHQSLGSQEFAQMLHRVRTPKNKEIVIAIDKYKPYDKEEDFLSYKDTESMLCNNYLLTQYDVHNNLIKKKAITKNTVEYPYKDEPIYDMYVRNVKETVLDRLNFTAQLFGYLKGKNYQLEAYSVNKNSYEKHFKDMTRLRKERIEEERVNLIEGIIESEDLDHETFQELIKRRNEFLDENDINSIRKYNFKNNYNIPEDTDKDKLRDLANEYYSHEKMRWYRNLVTVFKTKEQTTEKKIDILKHNQKMAHTYNNVYEDFKNKNNYARHYYPLKFIEELEFNINNLEKEINYTTLNKKLTKLKPLLAEMKYALFKNYGLKKIPYNILKMETAECLRFINKVIYNQYGMKILKYNYAKIEDNIIYRLQDNDVWSGLPNSFSNVKNLVKYEPRKYKDIDPTDLDPEHLIDKFDSDDD
jgi:hypothetical protein